MTARRMIIMLLLVAVVFGGIFGMKYMGQKAMTEYFNNQPVPPATVSTALAKSETWQTQLEAPGSLVATLGADVSSEVGGIVTKINVGSGSQVKKGQVMLELEDSTDRAELDRLKAQTKLARLTFERRKKLFDLEAVSQSEIEVAESEYAAARAAVQAQQAKVDEKRIIAPFSGDVGIIQVNLGTFLQPGQAAVTVRQLESLLVDFELPERWVGSVKTGMPIKLTTEAYGDRVFMGKVQAVDPQIDPASRNISVRGELPNEDRALLPGQFAKVTMDLLESHDYVVIPATAVNYNAYGTSVFVISEKEPAEKQEDAATSEAPAAAAEGQPPEAKWEAQNRFVKLGPTRGDLVTVIDGLKPGEEIATSGLLKLRSGQPVVINNDVTPDANPQPSPRQG